MNLNLGCGADGIDGWINIDKSWDARLSKYPFIHRFFQNIGIGFTDEMRDVPNLMTHDLSEDLPFDDESVEYIYTSHAIEHLGRDDAEDLIAESYRVLEQGGRIRIVTPDLEKYISEYLGDIELDGSEKYTSSADIFVNRTMMGKENIDMVAQRVRKSIFQPENNHYWLYDFKSIENMLEKEGFEEIERCKYQEGNVPDIEKLDNRPQTSIHVEARK
ncbi:class I SAM-dependent methyltransferase [Halopiger djelfimassiliensis]|uniref:class I SAM-dependent methyltransferase n=1 Tax=Halopiger djelfimassiliensis TaxID=1293047 RepID=UPI0009DC258A|nr:methyltransferase domain-containing protein [Halopiger djelfimassiliensis]